MSKFLFIIIVLFFTSKTAQALSPILPNGVKPSELQCITISSQKTCMYITELFLIGLSTFIVIIFLIFGIIIYRRYKNSTNDNAKATDL